MFPAASPCAGREAPPNRKKSAGSGGRLSQVAFAEAEGGTTRAAWSQSGDGAKRLRRRWICCEIASLWEKAKGESQLKIFQKTRKFPFDQNTNTQKHISSDSALEKQRSGGQCTSLVPAQDARALCSWTRTLGCYHNTHTCSSCKRFLHKWHVGAVPAVQEEGLGACSNGISISSIPETSWKP